MSFSFVVCRNTGEPVGEARETVGDRVLELRLNRVHSAKFKVDLFDEITPFLDPAIAPRLKVYRARSVAELAADPALDRQLVFYGSLPPQNVQEDAAKDSIDVTFLDPRWVLARRFSNPTGTDDQFSGVDQGLILMGLVDTQNARAGGDTWIRQGGVTTGVTRDRNYDRRPVLELIDQMTAVVDGPDVDVDPRDGFAEDPSSRIMANLRVFAQQGTDRTGLVHLVYGPDLPSNVLGMRRSRHEVTTLATFVGTSEAVGGARLAGTAGDPETSLFGILEDYVSDPDVSVQATLDQKAQGRVLERQVLREIIEVLEPTSEAPQPFENYGIGDTLLASCRKGNMIFTDRALRVHGLKITIDEQARTTTELALAQAN